MGFSQAQVRHLLALSADKQAPCGEIKAITEKHLAVIRRKIEDLRKIEKSLSSTVEQCAGGQVPKCPVIEVISAEGRSGRAR